MPPFRSDVDALEARHATLEAELADKLRARDEAARMLAEARARQRDEQVTADHAAGGPRRRQRRTALALAAVMMFALGIVLVARVADQRAERARNFRMIRVFTQLEMFTDEMCACPDRACLDRVNDAMNRWAVELAKEPADTSKPEPEWTAKATKLGDRMTKCTARLTSP
jgi:hypothetical protein